MKILNTFLEHKYGRDNRKKDLHDLVSIAPSHLWITKEK